MDNAPKWYDAHLEKYREVAYISGQEEYEALYQRSLADSDGFWAEQAKEYLTWYRDWDFVQGGDFKEAKVEWFGGGKLNASYNCLDRHLETIGDKVAFYWEGDRPSESRTVTYRQLYTEVNRFAAALQKLGVKRGDNVILYMPMIVELAVAMLACCRIGATHAVVFGGFSAEALANRIRNCKADTVITADGGFRAGKVVPLKFNVDQAIASGAEVERVIVFDRCGIDPPLAANEYWWQDLVEDPDLPEFVEPEQMDAEDPLFILYTSGSTGAPKGLVHSHGGYLLYAAMTCKLTFDLKPEEVFWCTADIGWVTGHSYSVYGPLINGFTSILFEGVPSYPTFERCWEIVEKYKVAKFYTAPTLVRAVAKEGGELVEKHDVSSLKLLGSVGEPINPEAWRWYYHYVGRDWAPIMDTWWQTETGGHMITPLPAVGPIKPGSCSFPFFGIEPVIIDPDTGRETAFPNQEGALFIKRPWPAIARTVYGDHERYRETYFSTFPGMYFTGDGARRDEDGYYWITGRIDDVINVSGHRLGTAEIESALVLHDDVAEAAVVGFPHPIKGQGIYAFVTPNSGVGKSDELKTDLVKLIRSEIGPIASPDAIQWADALPKTRSGKIMRRLLQKIAANDTAQMGDTSTIADPEVLELLIIERIELD